MKNDLWIWLDWHNPPQQRMVVVDDLWAKLKDAGDPKAPDDGVYAAFRKAMSIPKPVEGADFIPPTTEWVEDLYKQFMAWLEESRKDLLKGKKPRLDEKVELKAMAGSGVPQETRRLLEEKVGAWSD